MSAIIRLPFIDQLHLHLGNYPQFIQVILGPRQIGKTTSIQHYLEGTYKKKFHYHSADRVFSGGVAWLTEAWMSARADGALLVVDEVQKIENWAEIVKKFWDEEKKIKKPIQCVLLGSSSLDLHIGLTESLTGRFQMIPAFQWNYHESQEAYGLDFEEYLKFGGYPGSYPLRKDLQTWAQYLKHSIVETVVEKDILAAYKVKSPSLFKQAFELLVAYPAQEISFTKLLGQLQDKGNVELIQYYLRLFEGAFLIKSLHKFSTKAIRKKTSSPKILPLCPAFYFLQDLSEYTPEIRGRVFELVVGCVLNRLGYELTYWREGPNEVDYVLKQGKKIWAIEVKSGRRKKQSGLNVFLKFYPTAQPIVITPENYIAFEKNPIDFLK